MTELLDDIAMKTILAILSLLFTLETAMAAEYAAHEEWAYRTLPGDEGSTVLINAVDTDKNVGKIFHISILAVNSRRDHAAGGISKNLPYFAVSQVTLDKSLTKRVASRYPYREFLKGYVKWKREFKEGSTGVFNISVSEIVELVEKGTIESEVPVHSTSKQATNDDER